MPHPGALRILHLTAASDAGGLSRYLLDLHAGLDARGCHVTIAGERGPWHRRFERENAAWLDLSMRGGPLGLRKAAQKLRGFLQSWRPDLIHTHYRKPTLAARAAAKDLRLPILYTVHQPRIPLRGPWRWLSDFGDHVHAPSQDARTWLMEDARVPEQRITVIAHGVDPAQFPLRNGASREAARAKLQLSPAATVGVFVGRLDFPKNADWMLDVAEVAREKLSNLKILVAGEGPEGPDIRRDVQRRGLGDVIVMLGECDPLPLYQAADALLSPSEREGFGLVCAEAMCCGVPVIRTRTGGAQEMIEENVTGQTTAVNRAEFAAAAVEFLRDRARLEKMGPAAAEKIRREFTLDRQIDLTVALYRKLIAAGGN